MGDYGRVVGDAIVATLIIGVCIGAALILGGWALWHFLLSHLHLVWN